MSRYNIAIVGMGAVGRQMVAILEKSRIPVAELRLLVRRNAGEIIRFRGQKYVVECFTPGAFQNIDLVLMAAGGKASLELAPLALEAGAVVIDNSSAFRLSQMYRWLFRK